MLVCVYRVRVFVWGKKLFPGNKSAVFPISTVFGSFLTPQPTRALSMLLSRCVLTDATATRWGNVESACGRHSVRAQLHRVTHRGTSQECSACGATVKKDLSVRVHKCDCGYVADRDINAAINILHRGISIAGGNVTRMIERMKDKSEVVLTRPRTVY